MGLRQNMLDEPVSTLAWRKLVTFSPEEPVRTVCERMREQRVGAAVTLDDAGRPIGLFTEKLLIRLLQRDPDQMDRPIGPHATDYVVCIREDDSIARLVATMQKRDLRFICVCDGDGKALALTGLRGVMEHVVSYFPRSVLVEPMESNLSIEQREGA